MKDSWLLNKRIYGLMGMMKQFEMGELQKDASLMEKELSNAEKELHEKKSQMDSVADQIKAITGKDESIDVNVFDYGRKYFDRLQGELFHQQILKKNLDRKYKNKMNEVNEEYKQSKLYEKLVENNDELLRKDREDEEQKSLDDICSMRNSSGEVYE